MGNLPVVSGRRPFGIYGWEGNGRDSIGDQENL